MESSLSPRDIQARVRAGASVAEVAAESGLPESQVEPFAAPVLAERSYMIEQAQGHPVRRTGEHKSGRSLAAVVEQRLASSEIADPQQASEQIDWDSWREVDRRWTIALTSPEFAAHDGDLEDRALFTFDPRGRFSVAKNRAAKWLTGELVPDSPASDPDSEPTLDLLRDADDQEFGQHRPSGSKQSSASASPRTADPVGQPPVLGSTKQVEGSGRGHERLGREGLGGDNLGIEGLDPDQVADSQLDVLYDMLASFDEDSVNIYADLDLPITDEPLDEADPIDTDPSDTDPSATDPESSENGPDGLDDEVLVEEVVVARDVLVFDEPEEPEAEGPAAGRNGPSATTPAAPDSEHEEPAEPTQDPLSFTGPIPLEVEASSGEPGPGAGSPMQEEAAGQQSPESTTTPDSGQGLDAEPASTGPEATATTDAEPEQGTDETAEQPRPAKKATARKPATRRKAKGRASIPSWDEIMFGVKGDQDSPS